MKIEEQLKSERGKPLAEKKKVPLVLKPWRSRRAESEQAQSFRGAHMPVVV